MLTSPIDPKEDVWDVIVVQAQASFYSIDALLKAVFTSSALVTPLFLSVLSTTEIPVSRFQCLGKGLFLFFIWLESQH